MLNHKIFSPFIMQDFSLLLFLFFCVFFSFFFALHSLHIPSTADYAGQFMNTDGRRTCIISSAPFTRNVQRLQVYTIFNFHHPTIRGSRREPATLPHLQPSHPQHK